MIASIVTALYLSGYVEPNDAAVFLYIYGAGLIIAEIGLVSLGTLALNGALALYVAYVIQTGDNMVFGIPLDWPLVFGIAFIEIATIALITMILLHHRKMKITTGIEAMIGQKAVIVEWQDKTGTVRVQGENWKAASDQSLKLAKDQEVTVAAVDGLQVKITI